MQKKSVVTQLRPNEAFEGHFDVLRQNLTSDVKIDILDASTHCNVVKFEGNAKRLENENSKRILAQRIRNVSL